MVNMPGIKSGEQRGREREDIHRIERVVTGLGTQQPKKNATQPARCWTAAETAENPESRCGLPKVAGFSAKYRNKESHLGD